MLRRIPIDDRSEADSFGALYQEHHRMVYRTAYSITHNPSDAEDVLQIVFLNLLRREDRSELSKNVGGYLYRCAVNEALDLVAGRARQVADDEKVSAEERCEQSRSWLEDRMHEDLQHAILRLKQEDVEMLILRYEEGFSDADIAFMTGESRGKVAVALSRARAQLKKFMSGRKENEDEAPREFREVLGTAFSASAAGRSRGGRRAGSGPPSS